VQRCRAGRALNGVSDHNVRHRNGIKEDERCDHLHPTRRVERLISTIHHITPHTTPHPTITYHTHIRQQINRYESNEHNTALSNAARVSKRLPAATAPCHPPPQRLAAPHSPLR
jgi:hypothetical protein